ncbi:MAG: hypothetical protein QX199_18850 [Methylococcaceae bacterium]
MSYKEQHLVKGKNGGFGTTIYNACQFSRTSKHQQPLPKINPIAFGLRSLVSTVLNGQGFDADVIET